MESTERKDRKPEDGQSITVTAQERNLLKTLRELKDGEARVMVQNSIPVKVDLIRDLTT